MLAHISTSRGLTLAIAATAWFAAGCGDDRAAPASTTIATTTSTTTTSTTTTSTTTTSTTTTVAPTSTAAPEPPTGRDTFRVPMNGTVRVTLAWNCRGCVAELGDRHHPAVDYISRTDDTVVAAGDGVVVRRHEGCGPSSRGCGQSMGNFVFLEHHLDDGSVIHTFYAHLAEIDATAVEGACLPQGSRLGTMGNSGIATAAHLHFAFQTHTDILQYTRESSTEHGSRDPDEYYGTVRVRRCG